MTLSVGHWRSVALTLAISAKDGQLSDKKLSNFDSALTKFGH
jgi:hypothetical protein